MAPPPAWPVMRGTERENQGEMKIIKGLAWFPYFNFPLDFDLPIVAYPLLGAGGGGGGIQFPRIFYPTPQTHCQGVG